VSSWDDHSSSVSVMSLPLNLRTAFFTLSMNAASISSADAFRYCLPPSERHP